MTSEQLAWKIRRHGVEMTHLSGGSHLASILSVADVMGKLYADVLRVDPKNPKDENRDRFILSKGHAGASVYAALAESGFFPVDQRHRRASRSFRRQPVQRGGGKNHRKELEKG